MMKVIIPNDIKLLSCSIPESDVDDGPEWIATTTYAKDAKVRHEHVKYTSLADGNVGNDPAKTWSGDNAKWKKVGATRPWLMLDEFVETQTKEDKGKNLTFCVPYDRADAFALLNIAGFELRVGLYDLDIDTENPIWPSEWDFLTDLSEISLWQYVYNTIETARGWRLVKDISKMSLYEYNYWPIVAVDKFVRTSTIMPLHGKLCVELDAGSEELEAAIGHIVVGKCYELGWTEYDAELGFTDFSRKNTDEFGRTTLVRRSYSSPMSLPLYLHPDQSDWVYSLLTSVRGKPCLWIGDNTDDGFQALTIYGWLEDFRLVYAGPNEMRLSLEIQGLV